MLSGAPTSMYDWWVGNQVPVTIGNFLGGFLFTGAALWYLFTHAHLLRSWFRRSRDPHPLGRKTGRAWQTALQ